MLEGTGAGARVVDRLSMGGMEASELVTDPVTASERGNGFRWMLEVAMGDLGTMRAKGRHGVVHILREMGLWTDAEWKILVDRANKVGIRQEMEALKVKGNDKLSIWDAYNEVYEQYGDHKAELLDQELVANLAEKSSNGASYGSTIDALLDRITKFFEALRNAVRGLGFQTADVVFERMLSGEVAARAAGEEGRGRVDLAETSHELSPQEILLSSPEGQEALGSMGLMAIASDGGTFRAILDRIKAKYLALGFPGEVAISDLEAFELASKDGVRAAASPYAQGAAIRNAARMLLEKMRNTEREAAANIEQARSIADDVTIRRFEKMLESVSDQRERQEALAEAATEATSYFGAVDTFDIGMRAGVPANEAGSRLSVIEGGLAALSPSLTPDGGQSVYSLSDNLRTATPGEFGYHILRDGAEIGSAIGSIVMEDGEQIAYISWIGAKGLANRLGLDGVRQLREAFRRDFPDVKRFEGTRVGGARSGSGNTFQSVELPALSPSPTPPRPFTLSIDGRGEVSTREKEDGNRVRTYKVYGRDTDVTSAAGIRPSAREDAAAKGFDTSRILYHGSISPTRFAKFDLSRSGSSNDEGMLGRAVYLTPKREHAEGNTYKHNARDPEVRRRKGHIVEAYIRGNVFHWDRKNWQATIRRVKEIFPEYIDKFPDGRTKLDISFPEVDAFAQAMTRAGYAAIEDHDHAVAVFDPGNIYIIPPDGAEGLPSAAQERITASAMKLRDGTIVTAPNHTVAMHKIADERGIDYADALKLLDDPSGGFVTSTGRYVLRDEAAQIAARAEQVKNFSLPKVKGKDQLSAQDKISYAEEGRFTGAEQNPVSRPQSSFILSEQPDGSWELSFFNGGKGSAQIISDIESDLGNRIGPSGWLTPEAYEQWQAIAPERVADHQDVRGMWASPKALELAQAVAQEAKARQASPNLDMSPQARKARAEAMGFDTSQVWHHGTSGSFDAFDPTLVRYHTVASTWLTSSKAAASYFSEVANNTFREGRSILDLYVRRGRQLEVPGPRHFGYDSFDKILEKARQDGYDSVLFRDVNDDNQISDQLVVFDPSNIRFVNAAFDPAEEGSSRLLASLKSDEGGRIEPQLPWPTDGVRAASMPHPVQMGSQATTSSLEAPELGLSDLVENLTDTLGLTVRQGRLDPGLKARAGRAGARVFGQFSASTGITRTAIPNDFPVLVHEGGHALEVRPSTRDPLAQLKATHAAELVPGNPAPSALDLSEGFAEWFRFYLTDRTKAQTQAPGFLKDFEDMLDNQEPGMVLDLQAIQDGFQALLKASPAGAVRSRIQSTERPGKLGEIKEELQEKGFRKTLSDKLYAFFRGYTDRWHGLKVAVDHMLEQGGRQAGINLAEGERLVLKAINDPYKRARLAAQAKAQATATLLNGVRLRGMADPSGPSYQDALDAAFGGNRRSQWNEEKAELFGSYLISRSMLAEFDRHDRGELENPPDQLIPRDVWAKAKDDIEKAHPEFARGASILYQFQQNMLKLMYQEGFLTAEDYQTYSNRVDYVPRNRVMPDRSPSSVGAARGTKKRKVFMQFKGSTLDFINPLESIAQNVYAQQGRITLNGTIRALDNLARWAGPAGGPIAERLPARDMKGVRVDVREAMKDAAKQLSPDDAQDLIDMVDELFDEDAAATIFRATDINEKGEKIVYLYEDGKRVPIRMGDHDIGKDIFDAFTAVGTDNANMAFELATMGTQALRFGVTKAVSYVFNNFLRDQLQTWTLSENYTPFVTGTKGLKHVVANDDVSKRAAAFGVMMGGIDTNLQESAARDRDIKSLRRKGFWAVPLNWPRALHPVEWSWKAFMRTMEITEAGTRVGHMQAIESRALADGMTPEEAAWEAAYGANDVMPFDRSGSKMMVIARLVAFLNAAVQGMSAAARTVSGERNTYTNYRDAVSPYLKAGMGQPVSVAEKAAIPNAAKVWVKMMTMGIVGVSLAALYGGDDDESKEHQEFNDYMRATHWFFKINGTWWRFPKPFELAAISNAMEAGFAGYWKQDPRALKTFAQSLKHTMIPPHELQAMKLYYEMMTGKDTFRDKDIVGGDLRALAPEYQFNAYTSEFGRMVGKALGWSPAQIDHFMAGALGTMGRDLMNASDYMLPRVNMMTGGIIPGVSQTPRAEKSLEDMWFISRFSRRAGRGSLSVEEFWKQASRDGGKYTQAAETYKRLVAAGRADPRLNFEAKSFMANLTDDQKAYAYLEGGWFDEKDKDLHPVHRSRQVLQAISGIRKDILMDNLIKRSTVPDRRHKFREPEKVSLSPSDQRVVNEILEDLSMREARNALIVVGHPGWAQKEILSTGGLIKELQSKAPAVAEELEARLTKGRTKVVPFEKVQEAWPEARARILKEGPEASLADLRGYVPPSGALEVLISKPKAKRGAAPQINLPSFPGGGSLTVQ